MLARKKPVDPSELETICEGQSTAGQIIDRHVKAEKATNPSLPEAMLRQMIVRDECVCKVAHRLLAKEKQ